MLERDVANLRTTCRFAPELLAPTGKRSGRCFKAPRRPLTGRFERSEAVDLDGVLREIDDARTKKPPGGCAWRRWVGTTTRWFGVGLIRAKTRRTRRIKQP
jgi:hypothetical protein